MTERVLGGRYRLGERLGGGGMGTVWTAVDETLRRNVAVKEIRLPVDLPADERGRLAERARREARAAALVDHPNVIKVHDVVVEDDRPWIVMELVEGISLAQLLERSGLGVPQYVAHVGLKLLDALEAAHAQGVLHRDVKPSNVLISQDGRVVLTDFGIAGIDGDTSLTRTGDLTGSPGFIAPERLREQPTGPESDLWSLGATLYTAVEGRAPFQRETPMATLGAVLTEEPAPPRRAGSLAPLLWHLLNKEPAQRMRPDAIRQVLRNVAAGLPSGLHDPLPAPRAAKRRVLVPAAASVAVIAVLAGTAAALTVEKPAKPAADPTRTSSAAPETSATPTASDKARYVKTCSLLTRAQARQLLGGSPKQKSDSSSCLWYSGKRAITVRHLNRGAAKAPPQSEPEARGRFSVIRDLYEKPQVNGNAWGIDEIGVKHVKADTTAARTVRDVGAEAFAYESNGTSRPLDKAVVVLRSGGYVVEVALFHPRGAATPADAVRAARLVAQRLNELA